jgi:predicted MFS family arabinose efflux permease
MSFDAISAPREAGTPADLLSPGQSAAISDLSPDEVATIIPAQERMSVVGPAAARKPPSLLRKPAIAGLLLSEVVSSAGSQMSTMALPWFVLATTGSVTRMGLVFAAELIPLAPLGILAGIFVARFGVRRTMLLGDAARAPLIAAVPLLHLLGLLSFPVLLVIVMAVGTVTTPYIAAQRLALPEVVGDDEQVMMRASGLLEAAIRGAGLIGPALAGAVIGLIGAVNVLWVDAATFALSLVVLLPTLRIRVNRAGAVPAGGLLAGARAVLGDRLLACVAGVATLYGLFFPFVIASLPVMAELRYGHNAHVAGALLASWGGGALLGALTVGRLAARFRPLRMGAGAALALDGSLWFLPWHLPALAIGGVLVAAGIFTPLLNAPLITLLMTRTEPSVRAQAITFVLAANLLAGPMAYAVSGPLFSHWGTEPVLIVVAVGLAVCPLILARITVRPSDQTVPGPVAMRSS